MRTQNLAVRSNIYFAGFYLIKKAGRNSYYYMELFAYQLLHYILLKKILQENNMEPKTKDVVNLHGN